MSIDFLHEKIRKLKSPLIVDMSITEELLPPHLLEQEGSFVKAYPRFCRELLEALAGVVPGVRFYDGTHSPTEDERRLYGFSMAWMHHKGRNKHHYEYWIDYKQDAECSGKPFFLPLEKSTERLRGRISGISELATKEKDEDKN